MITAKEFGERFGFEPKQDDLHRVNCDKAGEVGHLMCGLCSGCGKPRFVCGGRCINDRLRQLGLERIGDELFALPDELNGFPVVRVFRPADVRHLGVETDSNSVFIVRERSLSKTAHYVVVAESGISDMVYSLLDDKTIHTIRARINNSIVAEVSNGDLFKDPAGKWRHSCEYWFGCLQSQD